MNKTERILQKNEKRAHIACELFGECVRSSGKYISKYVSVGVDGLEITVKL